MAKLKNSASGFEKWRAAHSAALRRPQIIPMKGDGPVTRGWFRNAGEIAMLGLGNWRPHRVNLTAARYMDWLDERGAKRELDNRRLRAA